MNKLSLPLFLVAATIFSSAANAEPAAERIFSVRTAKVARKTIAQPLVKTGSLTAPAEVAFSPRVSGRLEATARADGSLLEEGSLVKKGELIATIDSREYAAKKSAAAAALLAAEAQVADKKREFLRTEALLKDQTATEQEFDLAKSALAIAEANAAGAKAELEEAELNLADTKLYAPMDAVISVKHLHPGAMVSSSSVIYTLTQTSPLKVLLSLPTSVYPILEKEKTTVEVTVDAYPEEVLKLPIREVYPTADSVTRTVTIRLDLENPTNKYTPGMYARGEVALNERENVLVIPYNALVRRLNEYFVYRVIDGRAVVTPVTPGVRYDDVIEVKSGVAFDEEIVTDGLHRLADGVKVNIFEQ